MEPVPPDVWIHIFEYLHVTCLSPVLKCCKYFTTNDRIKTYISGRVLRHIQISWMFKHNACSGYAERDKCNDELLVLDIGSITKKEICNKLICDRDEIIAKSYEFYSKKYANMSNKEIANFVLGCKMNSWFVLKWIYEKMSPERFEVKLQKTIAQQLLHFFPLIKKVKSPKVRNYDYAIVYYKERPRWKKYKGWTKCKIIYLTHFNSSIEKAVFVAEETSIQKRCKETSTYLLSFDQSLKPCFFAKSQQYFVFPAKMYRRMLHNDSLVRKAFEDSIKYGATIVQKSAMNQ